MSFSGLMINHDSVAKNPNSGANWVRDAAAALPQSEFRKPAVDAEGDPEFAVVSWISGVEDAAFWLNNLITIHDNGGTTSSPKKIKAAARELLRLLGEG